MKALADGLVDRDIVELWEFDNALTSIGSTPTKSRRSLPSAVLGRGPRQRLQALVARLSGPAGGTEIGAALAGLLAQSTTRDVLLITDGKSHALDVQTLAQSGRRISVVLIGEDSLEANVGHLAALSGGDIFVVAGSDLREVLAAVVGALRRPCEPLALITGELRQIKTCRGNAALLAKWRPGDGPISRDVLGHAVAALAAGLALPALGPDAAAELAEAEGLVTHLTSLVLVDEAAQIQQGVPAARKIALPSPRTSLKLCAPRLSAAISPALGAVYSLGSAQPAPPLRRPAMPDIPPSALIDLSWMGSRIDWDAGPNQLLAGDLSGLDRDIVRLIERAAALAEVVALAAHLKIQAVTLIIGLVARAHFAANRSAGRIAKAVLGARTSPDLDALGLRLGLEIISSY